MSIYLPLMLIMQSLERIDIIFIMPIVTHLIFQMLMVTGLFSVPMDVQLVVVVIGDLFKLHLVQILILHLHI